MTYISSIQQHWLFSEVYKGAAETALFFSSAEGRMVILTEILILVAFSMTLFLLQQWYQKERYAQELQRQKLEAELNLLKSQVNPHFLFNALNSIFVMMEKDVNKSRNMLVQLSDVLSHQIYETQKLSVPLQTEVNNLRNYIDIESTRHGALANIVVDIEEHLNGLQIAPMLLLPIVENAFKHSKSNKSYWVKIGLNLDGCELLFKVENSKGEQAKSNGGIGLPNLQRQLRLLYPERHRILVKNEENSFTIDLNIKLDDHPLSYS